VLSVVAGLLRPETARVVLEGTTLTGRQDGRDVSPHVSPHARQVAMLAQDPLLFPHLSAADNVGFGPRSRGASRRQSRETALRWLAEVGVEDLAERRPHQLSGGQAQRVAVARALAAEPRLLLLDEPMAALDVAVAPALRQTLRRVLRERSALIVTHDALDALLLSDRVVVLDKGRVVEVGPSADVLARPRSAFAARIAGLNLLAGTWRDGAVQTSAGHHVTGKAPRPAPPPGAEVVAVFRPSAVSIFQEPPGGSPRNVLEVTITELEPRGDQVRVHAEGLSADITPLSAAELNLAAGARVVFSIKAAETDVYPA
jgi:molybdate transport system ATP-binding protein